MLYLFSKLRGQVSFSLISPGWGICVATDISIAWLCASFVFGALHPAVKFLLLLAVVDDVGGLVIIAAFYPNDEHPVRPIWLLLVLAGMFLAILMRFFKVNYWALYVFVCGPIVWYGLLRTGVHVALALCFIIPIIPISCLSHSRSPDPEAAERELAVPHFSPGELSPTLIAKTEFCKQGAKSLVFTQTEIGKKQIPFGSTSIAEEDISCEDAESSSSPHSKREERTSDRRGSENTLVEGIDGHSGPLYRFEEDMKLFVHCGLFFFALGNAGVQLSHFGLVTFNISFSLIIGKTLGIFLFGAFAVRMLKIPLPEGMTLRHLLVVAIICGSGLTVALFIANEAYDHPPFIAQAKIGALLSIGAGFFALLCAKLFGIQKVTEVNMAIDEPTPSHTRV